MHALPHNVTPESAVQGVPAGAWAVGVSGGADSVALLHLLRECRAELSLHIAHLDHETRAGESARDAAFVRQLAADLALPVTVAQRSGIEPAMARLPRNRSARFRACRLALFQRVVREHGLRGVILAHHADDQAETILQRLLRGSGAAGAAEVAGGAGGSGGAGLTGMTFLSSVGGLAICRPLLHLRRAGLRRWLVERGIAWREDSSNTSPLQQRNRVRAMIEHHDALTNAALELGVACAALSDWLGAQARVAIGDAADGISLSRLRDLPPPVAREAARRWLKAQAGGAAEIPPAAVERLLGMVEDAASPARQHFPGGVLIRRRGGMLMQVRRSVGNRATKRRSDGATKGEAGEE